MSLCINPNCPQPDHPGNDGNRFCQSCGSDLILQERYRVMRLLSDKSGFGRVYEAYERGVPKILKVLKEEHSRNSKAVELFRQEALVLSQLRHPGIPAVPVDGYFQFAVRGLREPLHCLIMEKIDGPNLREWMRQQGHNPISEKQAIHWLRQITDVLHRVHEKNYFHRDIKPENIMLRSNGQLVLVDFGAAREMTYSYLAQLGATGGVTRISSAGYTPPEQEKGQAVPQSDFFALGWTFVYLLTGRSPTDPDIYDSLTNEHHWRDCAPQISPAFADFIDGMIAPRAADRPRTTEEILYALQELAAGSSANIVVVSPRTHPSTPPTGPITSPPKVTQADQPTVLQTSKTLFQALPLRSRWLLGGMALVIVGLATYGIVRIALCEWRQDCLILPMSPAKVLSPAQTLTGHTGLVNRVLFANGGKTLVSAGADSKILVWDVATGKLVRTLSGHTGFVNALAVSGDGRILATGGADKLILLWDLTTGQLLNTLQGHTNPVNALLFTPDSTLVSASADRTIRTWQVSTGKPIHVMQGHSSFVNAIALSPDGETLASGGADTKIIVWNLSSGQPIRELTGFSGFINALEISHDGTTLVGAGTDKIIHRWNLADGTAQADLKGHTGFINSLSIQGDDKVLFSSDAEGRLLVWDLVQGKAIATYTGKGAPLDHFAISPDWRTIATGRGFETVWVWKLPAIAN